jgi:hypothetical protein
MKRFRVHFKVNATQDGGQRSPPMARWAFVYDDSREGAEAQVRALVAANWDALQAIGFKLDAVMEETQESGPICGRTFASWLSRLRASNKEILTTDDGSTGALADEIRALQVARVGR